MNPKLLAQVLFQLRKGKYEASILILKSWLQEAKTGDIHNLIQSCTSTERPKLVTLLRDVMTCYPRTVVGIPTLLYYVPPADVNSFEEFSNTVSGVTLPVQAPHLTDFTFLGWVPATEDYPLQIPLPPKEVFIPAGRISGLVALFRTHPHLELADCEFPDAWWPTYFSGVPGSVKMTARTLAPYTDALEAARAQYYAASAKVENIARYFASETYIEHARLSGEHFRLECVRYHPHPGWN